AKACYLASVVVVVHEQDHGELKEAPLPSRSAVVRGLVVLVMLGALVPSVLGLLGRWGWLFDLCNHFRFQYAAVLLVTALALFLLRSWKLAAAAAAGCAMNLFFVLPLYLGSPASADLARPTMTVMHYNVNTSNSNHAGVIAEIYTQNPDLLFVQEVNHRWVDALKAGLQGYELIVDQSRTDNFGIACFQRKAGDDRPAIAIVSSRVYDVTNDIAQVPVIEAELTLEGDTISVLSIHPLPPVSVLYARARDATLYAAGEWAAEQADPCIVVGDFNATPWSTAFRDLRSSGELVNSQVGFGRAPTWPASLNTLGMIPIDHLLHSGELTTVNRVVGEANGSDHLPLIVEIGWKAGP
ncbi:MAG: endonuclease/exonuclease/phosphatase family protein, partial [Phycisphaeraceae bacterium]